MTELINIDGQKIELKHIAFDTALDWHQAKQNCSDLGKGWRLPTISELKFIYKELHKKDNFHSAIYWSGTESSSLRAWTLDFALGTDDHGYHKDKKAFMMAVRTKHI